MAASLGVPFLGRIPLYQPIREGGDSGVPLMISEPDAPAARAHHDRGRADRRAGLDCQLQQADDSAHRGPMNISYTKHTLDNGLDVLIHEDHACPIVAVNIWYHVGSKNETPGRTGFAHFFEHLMFEGSEHHDKGYFPPLQGAGALLNGSTNADRTNYWEVVPTNAFELALWMESDRMGYLLPALTEAKFSNQRDVVLNERRQSYENRPYGLAPMAMLAALYPAGPPVPLDDDRRDRRSARRAARRSPRVLRARITIRRTRRSRIAGDVDTDEALALVRRLLRGHCAGACACSRCGPSIRR